MSKICYASAVIRGNEAYPDLHGVIRFRQIPAGVLVTARIWELPGEDGIFAFHIHEGEECTDTGKDPFSGAKGHYNPDKKPHPAHRGDMPPLFGNQGFAYLSFLTNRFTVEEILGKTVIIHRHADDFTSQPAGNAGEKMACGKIVRSDPGLSC